MLAASSGALPIHTFWPTGAIHTLATVNRDGSSAENLGSQQVKLLFFPLLLALC